MCFFTVRRCGSSSSRKQAASAATATTATATVVSRGQGAGGPRQLVGGRGPGPGGTAHRASPLTATNIPHCAFSPASRKANRERAGMPAVWRASQRKPTRPRRLGYSGSSAAFPSTGQALRRQDARTPRWQVAQDGPRQAESSWAPPASAPLEFEVWAPPPPGPPPMARGPAAGSCRCALSRTFRTARVPAAVRHWQRVACIACYTMARRCCTAEAVTTSRVTFSAGRPRCSCGTPRAPRPASALLDNKTHRSRAVRAPSAPLRPCRCKDGLVLFARTDRRLLAGTAFKAAHRKFSLFHHMVRFSERRGRSVRVRLMKDWPLRTYGGGAVRRGTLSLKLGRNKKQGKKGT